MVSDGENGVIFLGLREFGDEVKGNNFEWICLRLGEYRCQWSLGGSGVDLMALTLCAPLNILYHVLSESRPPVLSLDQICGPTDPWVVVNELFRLRGLSGYNHPSILLPYTIDFLQLVGVDPRVNHTFVLFLSALWLR